MQPVGKTKPTGNTLVTLAFDLRYMVPRKDGYKHEVTSQKNNVALRNALHDTVVLPNRMLIYYRRVQVSTWLTEPSFDNATN